MIFLHLKKLVLYTFILMILTACNLPSVTQMAGESIIQSPNEAMEEIGINEQKSNQTPTPENETEPEIIVDNTIDSIKTNEGGTSGPEANTNSPLPSVQTEQGIAPSPTPAEITGNICYLTIQCDTILSNIESLDSDKIEMVPDNGIIYSREVEFEDGDSVFDLLQREMKNEKIHFEFVTTPGNGNVYIKGINNIYEFDCGELSGWLYKVNGLFPVYSCSEYLLMNEDVVEIVYTCDLGSDVGKE